MAVELTDRQIADMAIRTLNGMGADWMPSAQLRAEMLAAWQDDDEDKPDLPLARMAKLLRDHGQQPEVREYDGKTMRGYSRRQFTKVITDWSVQAMAAEEFEHGHDIDTCAPRVLDWVASLDPDWGMKIEVMKAERGFEPKTILASLCAYVLENNLHMRLPAHEAVQGVYWTPEKVPCPICDTEYRMAYPGQRTCLNPECGRAFHKLQEASSEQT